MLGVNGVRLLGYRSGVARATEAILNGLVEVGHPFGEIRVYTPEPLPDDVVLPEGAVNEVVASALPRGLWEQISLPRAHGRRGLLLCPSYVVPVASGSPTFLIHHGSYEGYPSAFPFWARTKARAVYAMSARCATLVSTVSEHSRRDLERFYGIDPETVHVVPDGVDTRRFRPLDDSAGIAAWRRRVLGEDVPFLLYVGKPTRRRNLPALIAAFGQLKAGCGLPHKLLLIGTAMAGSPFEKDVAKAGLAGDVVALPYADHDEIVLAYNAADLLVYPSSYEGFGMPVLEAMACGTPAIALDNTAFPEFASGVALLLPDADVATLREGIGSVLDDPERRAEMSRSGLERAARYDWRSIAARYRDLMLTVAP
jgi:glycosyltransferase involved in cell wall biosynthesis